MTNIKLRLWSIRFYSRSFYSLQLPLRTKWRESFANTTLAFFSYTRHLVKTVAFNHKCFPFTIIAHETIQFFASYFIYAFIVIPFVLLSTLLIHHPLKNTSIYFVVGKDSNSEKKLNFRSQLFIFNCVLCTTTFNYLAHAFFQSLRLNQINWHLYDVVTSKDVKMDMNLPLAKMISIIIQIVLFNMSNTAEYPDWISFILAIYSWLVLCKKFAANVTKLDQSFFIYLGRKDSNDAIKLRCLITSRNISCRKDIKKFHAVRLLYCSIIFEYLRIFYVNVYAWVCE